MTTEQKFPGALEIRSKQDVDLRNAIGYAYLHSPFYRAWMDKHQVDPQSIQQTADLVHLPTTTKDDLHRHNDDFLCVERSRIAEYMTTSGTLGSPVTIALTQADLDRLARNECGSFLCADGYAGEVYQLMLTLDRQFMAGIAYYAGLMRMGGAVIRVGPGVPSLQWENILRWKPDAIVAVPSFILKLIRYAQENGIDYRESSVKKAICIGENIRQTDFSLNELGRRIAQEWPIKLYSTYASTEMQTAFTECGAGQGGHLQPDLLVVEILDSVGNPVQEGQPGEVTITTLGIEAMPLIRYRTGDICVAHTSPCSCGRNSLRLSPVIGRQKQMIKFKGTTLFLPALSDILHSMEDIQDYVVETFSNELGTDEIRLHLCLEQYSDETDRKIRAYLQAKLRVSPQVQYVDREQLQRIQDPGVGRKPIRFIDRRP